MSKSEDMRRLIDLANNNKIISESYGENEVNPFKAFSSWKFQEGLTGVAVTEDEVVPFKKKKSEHEKYADAFSKQHNDEHRHGVGWIECTYCGDVNCDYDCDESQADGFNEGATGLTGQQDSDPCWDGYHQVGTKMKNGKKVPNCVPDKPKRS